MYNVYIVKCADESYYTGVAKDLEKRIREHNAGKRGAKYTRARRPVKLVYSRAFRNRVNAQKAEVGIKALSRNDKIRLIKGI